MIGSVKFSEEQLNILRRARETYGDSAQILVSNEELCELAAVCAKYPRYEFPETARMELYGKALDEVADVLIVLDHIINIFGITEVDLQKRMDMKIARLSNWLDASPSMEQTTRDREVPEVKSCPCGGCRYYKNFHELKIGGKCYLCKGTGKNFAPKED